MSVAGSKRDVLSSKFDFINLYVCPLEGGVVRGFGGCGGFYVDGLLDGVGV